ncbi:hypothetical protein ACTGJ9_035805 [Bradyrhizobium sp. RDM12]
MTVSAIEDLWTIEQIAGVQGPVRCLSILLSQVLSPPFSSAADARGGCEDASRIRAAKLLGLAEPARELDSNCHGLIDRQAGVTSILQLGEIGSRPSYGALDDSNALSAVHLGAGKPFICYDAKDDGSWAVTVHRVFQNLPLQPEDIRLLECAFERALNALELVDRAAPATNVVAKIVIESLPDGHPRS